MLLVIGDLPAFGRIEMFAPSADSAFRPGGRETRGCPLADHRASFIPPGQTLCPFTIVTLAEQSAPAARLWPACATLGRDRHDRSGTRDEKVFVDTILEPPVADSAPRRRGCRACSLACRKSNAASAADGDGSILRCAATRRSGEIAGSRVTTWRGQPAGSNPLGAAVPVGTGFT